MYHESLHADTHQCNSCINLLIELLSHMIITFRYTYFTCTFKDNLWSYQEAFSAVNEIAQQALKKVGAFVIPHIWNESLPYWRIHPERKQDFAHYCIFQNQSVHTLWSTNIIDAILEH